jgi:hypothetical protein
MMGVNDAGRQGASGDGGVSVLNRWPMKSRINIQSLLTIGT